MTIPVERSETEEFTPQSLKDKMGDDAPVFRLKSPTEREQRAFRRRTRQMGLTAYPDEAFFDEKLLAIDLYWPPEVASEYRMKLVELAEKERQSIDLSPPEQAWLRKLNRELFDAHDELRAMEADQKEFHEYVPLVAIATYVSGWSGFDASFVLDAGFLSWKSVAAIRKELDRLGSEHCPDTPSLPFLELYGRALQLNSLTGDEEKNSPSPSQPTASQDASTTATTGTKKSKQSSGEKDLADSPSTSSSPEANPESA